MSEEKNLCGSGACAPSAAQNDRTATPWTPGPWRVVCTNPRAANPNMGWWDVETPNGRVVAASLTLADAHAVATMPALYEALEAIARSTEWSCLEADVQNAARAALALAQPND